MKIGLFIPCYVDVIFPEVGMATYKLLRSLNLDIEYPERQKCCGQPMGNAGFENMSSKLVDEYDQIFSSYDYVVAPSASCAAYIKLYHKKIVNHPCHAAEKTMDIVEFLHDVAKIKELPQSSFPHKVSIHNSCHGVREVGLSSPSEKNIPAFNKIKDLLQLVNGIEIFEPERVDECCGFGGMFAIEEPDVSAKMGHDKISRHMATGAEYITGADSSCLMHMQGLANRDNIPIKFIHVTEILASGL